MSGVVCVVEDRIAHRVEHPGYAGTHLARSEHRTVAPGCSSDLGEPRARPAPGETGVEHADEVVELLLGRDCAAAVQGGVDREPDDLDRTALVDEHVVGHQPTVGQPLALGVGQQLGDLAGDPGGATWGEGLVCQQDVERVTLAPFVDDVAPVADRAGVEHA